MPFVVASDGVQLSYRVEGTGPPLLLHLGTGGDARMWGSAGYLPALTAKFRCIVFDHRGHGPSDHPVGPEANHIDRLAEDVINLLDSLMVVRTGFWGYSSGISVGLKVADEHPDRIRCLVGSGTIRPQSPEDERPEALAEELASYREHGWNDRIDAFVKQEGTIPEWMRRSIRETDIEHAIGFAASRPTWGWDEWGSLNRIAAPTLFITGALEDPDDRMAHAAALMRDGRRLRIPDKGHINGFIESASILDDAMRFLVAHS